MEQRITNRLLAYLVIATCTFSCTRSRSETLERAHNPPRAVVSVARAGSASANASPAVAAPTPASPTVSAAPLQASAEPSAFPPAPASNSTIVARAKVVSKVRKIARPQYGAGLIRYPQVAVKDPNAARAINDSIAQIIADNYDPTEEPVGLIGMSFVVNHNDDDLLSLTFELEANGAYPTIWHEHRCYLLSTGERVTSKSAFVRQKTSLLLAKLDAMLKSEIDMARRGKLPKLGPECADAMPPEAHFQASSLEAMQVRSTGLLFHFDYGFPHVERACEPPGEFFLSYSELAPFLLPDGPLARVALGAQNRAAPRLRTAK